jgi:hypothetical protein
MYHFGAVVPFALQVVCKVHAIIDSVHAYYVLFTSAKKSGQAETEM